MNCDLLLDSCGEVGCRLLAGGAEIYRVEETVTRLLGAYGVRGDVFALPSCLIVSFQDSEGRAYTRMRRTGAPATDIDVIERFNALSRSVCANPPPVERLAVLVRSTADSCRTYPPAVNLLGYFLGALFFTFLFRGGFLDALAAGLAGVVSGVCVLALDRLKVNFFFKTVAAALVLGLTVCLLQIAGMPLHMGATIIGALMVLLPGILFTNFMCDLITGDVFSGTSSFIRAVLTGTAVAVGSGAALSLFAGCGVTAEETLPPNFYSAFFQCATAFIACVGFCLMYNIHGGGILLCCLGGSLGWAANLAAAQFLDNTLLCYLVAAVAITAYSQVVARVRKYPVTAYLVVSYFPLVPGSYIYYAMYYALQGQQQRFLESGVTALGVAASIAMGTLLVTTTVRTLTRR